ncbi:hypothetical protein ACNPM2_10910 [Stenotrophomonas geniculata]|uniref:hypothetical protein n=1 Tax=Stenotrophomonas geniculata TaxID=86188 RepID=UPI003AB0477A
MDFGQRVALAVIGVVVLGAAAMWLVISGSSPTESREGASKLVPEAAAVSAACVQAVESLESSGEARPGRVDSSGADVLVDERWAAMNFSTQQFNARCLSNYGAGSSEKWIARIRFINQRTGVVYGLLEGDQYSIP